MDTIEKQNEELRGEIRQTLSLAGAVTLLVVASVVIGLAL
jgi:hypothetical protein